MNNINTDGLPPEMQARIAEIIEKAKTGQPSAQPQQQAPAAPAPAAPIQRQPSLMDHVIALRTEVNQLAQMVQAQGQVTEAVGNAVGQMYQMFQQQTEPTSYSSNFQEAQPSQVDDF